MRPALALLTGLLAALLLGACSGELYGEERGSAPAPDSPSSPAAPAPPKDVLEPGLREDPDGDLVPTAIEERLGTDPRVDECQEKLDCPVVGAGGQIEPEQRNSTLLMLDSSGSMRGPAGGGKTKIDAARGGARALRDRNPGLLRARLSGLRPGGLERRGRQAREL